ncbi:hypothetical protein AMJ52_02410 [candidate division TA06 bacterium DG_78]|uniref:SnoaL-like domain-containing protein n=1 Tax=candidate division TA06 bacterium DG_78 TaxID=1703772 RepID=A0A0S7YGX6_UNCT6|nr:MAG: hypothetical protein AMJ52_02410 [candidate division TA06 bacterium DG_78]
MNQKNIVDVALTFIEKINHRNFDGLLKIMSLDHKAIDEAGGVTAGSEKAVKIIADYITQRPNFQIHINDVYFKNDIVIIIGRTTGSCAETSYDTEIKDKLIYVLKVENEKVTEFRYALKYDDKTTSDLDIASAIKITE